MALKSIENGKIDTSFSEFLVAGGSVLNKNKAVKKYGKFNRKIFVQFLLMSIMEGIPVLPYRYYSTAGRMIMHSELLMIGNKRQLLELIFKK